MIYLASPYSHPSAEVQEARYRAVRDYTIEQIKRGRAIFSPIIYAHRMAEELSLGTTAADWIEFNEQMMMASSIVSILCIDGWDKSLGVACEIKFAQENRIPTVYVRGPF